MTTERSWFQRLLGCLQGNLALASFLALSGGFLQSVNLLAENKISPLSYPNLTLFLLSQTLSEFFLVAFILAIFLTFFFALRRQNDFSRSSLFMREILFVLSLITLLVILKKYYPNRLEGQAAYLVFYTSRWVKENSVLFAAMALMAVIFTWGGERIRFLNRLLSLRSTIVYLMLLVIINAGTFAYAKMQQENLRRKDAPNIILLTVDTLPANHMSLYGYPRQTTPHLDRLAEESVTFKNAVPTWTKTNQSFAGLFTGKYCYATGIGDGVASSLPRHNFLIAEILKNAGYQTAAFVSNANLSRYFNYNDGFEDYFELWKKQQGPAHERGWYKADRVTQESLLWLEKNRSNKFFMWIHYIDPHTPYHPPAPYNHLFTEDAFSNRYDDLPLDQIKLSNRLGAEKDPDFYIAQHDGAIRYTDDQIQLILDKLDAWGLKENTLLIFTADHGESFVENHLYFEHGLFTYENCARVPLMIRYPSSLPSPRRIEEVVSLVDVFPTLFDFAGISNLPAVQGHNLRPALQGGTWDRPDQVLIESNDQDAIRSKDWKLIHAYSNDTQKIGTEPFFELYDLRKDPEEKNNLASKGMAEEERLKTILFSKFPGMAFKAKGRQNASRPDVDPATLEQLKSLGYIN